MKWSNDRDLAVLSRSVLKLKKNMPTGISTRIIDTKQTDHKRFNMHWTSVTAGPLLVTLFYECWELSEFFDRDQMRFYALQPSHSACLLRTLDIWLLSPRYDVNRLKAKWFYRKRLCVIHSGLGRWSVCFSSWRRRDDQRVYGFSEICLSFFLRSTSDTGDQRGT